MATTRGERNKKKTSVFVFANHDILLRFGQPRISALDICRPRERQGDPVFSAFRLFLCRLCCHIGVLCCGRCACVPIHELAFVFVLVFLFESLLVASNSRVRLFALLLLFVRVRLLVRLLLRVLLFV